MESKVMNDIMTVWVNQFISNRGTDLVLSLCSCLLQVRCLPPSVQRRSDHRRL